MTKEKPPEDRRAASQKRYSDVRASEWPITSAATYQACLRKADTMTPKIRDLCLARIRFGHAMMAFDKALRAWNPQVTKTPSDQRVYNKLRGIRTQMDKWYGNFPLQIQ